MKLVAGIVVLAGAAVLALVLLTRTGPEATKTPRHPADELRAAGDSHYANDPGKAEVAYRTIIEQFGASKNPEDAARVASARIRLGYLSGKEGRWRDSRREFLAAAANAPDAESSGSDFGGIKDQAQYQAAVTLQAEGKQGEARAAFERFLRERSSSSLAQAAYRRLTALNGGTPKPEHERLYQVALKAQEEQARQEIANCGPKAVAYIAAKWGQRRLEFKELRDLAGTTTEGTSLKGIQTALSAVGLSAEGMLLNAEDFRRLEAPAVWLVGQHYLVVEHLDGESVTVYDPIIDRKRTLALPPETDRSFAATVLLLKRDSR